MSTDLAYGFKKTLSATVDQADARVREVLKKEGFGVLTEIDVQSTLKQKLNEDFRPYPHDRRSAARHGRRPAVTSPRV